jgi:protein-disulfide isomerase
MTLSAPDSNPPTPIAPVVPPAPVVKKKSSIRGIDVLLLVFVGIAAVLSGFTFLQINNLKNELGSSNRAALAQAVKSLPTNEADAANNEPVFSDVAVESDDPSMGSEDAPVTIIEFGDFECPFCARFAQTIKQAIDSYSSDQVRFVYRHFPLDFHEQAEPSAIAAQCVYQLAGSEAFFEYHDQLYARQSELGEELYQELAQEVDGVDMDAFASCQSDPDIKAAIQKDARDGSVAGVQGTPATFINGKLISGAVPLADIKAEIDAALDT